MQKQSHVSICVVAVILLALTVVGSVWDLEIVKATFIGQLPSENAFGIIFSYIGIIPTFVGWSFLGSIIFCLSKKHIEDTKKRRWLMAFAILLFVLSFFYFCNTIYLSNVNAFEIHFAVAYSIGIAVLCATAYLGYKLSAKSDDGELLKKVLFLAVVSLITLVIISVTKKIMSRPRFRFVLAMDNMDYFKNWWQSGSTLKASLDLGAVSDEFSSFPSGHSAYSMFAIFLFPFIADSVRGLKKFKPYFFVMGFIWWGATALSRMTVGAHYLSDVAIAGLVTILAYIAVLLAKKIAKKK